MTTRRAQRKKLSRRFHVGDLVTWGNGRISHAVTRVTPHGVYVDASSEGFGEIFLHFAPGSTSKREPGPPRHAG